MFEFNQDFFAELQSEAEENSRLRAHYNIHNSHSEPVQRLCISLRSGTYVRPHCHLDANGWEILMTLKGAVALLIFDSGGKVIKRIEMQPGEGVQLKPNTWHTVFPVTKSAILFEVKEGPYTPKRICDFASWSPEEGGNEVKAFLDWANNANIGDKFIT